MRAEEAAEVEAGAFRALLRLHKYFLVKLKFIDVGESPISITPRVYTPQAAATLHLLWLLLVLLFAQKKRERARGLTRTRPHENLNRHETEIIYGSVASFRVVHRIYLSY